MTAQEVFGLNKQCVVVWLCCEALREVLPEMIGESRHESMAGWQDTVQRYIGHDKESSSLRRVKYVMSIVQTSVVAIRMQLPDPPSQPELNHHMISTTFPRPSVS